MSAPPRPPALPRDPIPIEQAVGLFPTLRQSILAKFDDCNLSALFELRHSWGWNTHPQASGILFHRFAAEFLRTLREMGERSMPVAEALEILYETIRQADVPMHERVRCPLRDIRMLRMIAIKFAHDNVFNVHRILDIERQLTADITYRDVDGSAITRAITGTPDVLMTGAPDGDGTVRSAVVIDWKSGWALPPENVDPDPAHEDDGEHISYEGYFQQRFYGLLVMRNYPAVERVTLREFYPRKTEVREATVTRADLEHIEREMTLLVEHFDATIAAGTRDAGKLVESSAWRPSPGHHCGFCSKPGSCPIEREAREAGAITNPRVAKRYAGEFEQATRVRTHRMRALKAYTMTNGPIELKDAKGRRMIGHRERVEKFTRRDGSEGTRTKSVFGTYTPDASDRGPEGIDKQLEQAMRDSVAESRAARV